MWCDLLNLLHLCAPPKTLLQYLIHDPSFPHDCTAPITITADFVATFTFCYNRSNILLLTINFGVLLKCECNHSFSLKARGLFLLVLPNFNFWWWQLVNWQLCSILFPKQFDKTTDIKVIKNNRKLVTWRQQCSIILHLSTFTTRRLHSQLKGYFLPSFTSWF